MTHRASAVAVVALALLSAGLAMSYAQSKMDEAIATVGEPAAAASAASPGPEADDRAVAIAMPSRPNDVVLGDPVTKQRYLDAMQRYYEYRANGYAYRSRVFEWQLFSSRVIFAVVLVLVGAGIYFAGAQFRSAMRAASRTSSTTESGTEAQGMPLETQLEISAKGLVVNSSVMGVIILALSLGFFYLYLVYAYPITDVF